MELVLLKKKKLNLFCMKPLFLVKVKGMTKKLQEITTKTYILDTL